MKQDYTNSERNSLEAFSNKKSFRFAFLTLFFLILIGGTTINDAKASHFRYGDLSWRIDENDPSGKTIIFRLNTGWRCCPNHRLDFGDGTSSSFATNYTGSANGAQYYTGSISHTYASNGSYKAQFRGGAKIGGLQNNANGSWNIFSQVNVGTGNNSPVTSLPAIVNLQVGLSGATFSVPASDPDGNTLSYRIATSADGWPGSNPSGFSIHATTGVVTWNTSGTSIGQLWNAGIIVSDNNGAEVLVDFIMLITQQSNPPAFDYTAGKTPTNGTTYQASPGQAVSFDLEAYDTDPGSTVAISAAGLPVGAQISPTLGATGNPISHSFSWTPLASQFGTYVINFIAQDNNGVQTATSVSIIVSLKPQFDVPPTPAMNTHDYIVAPGTPISYTVQASDPDPTDVVTINKVEGKSMSGAAIALYSGASFSPLPSASGNPTSGVFSWTPAASDWGHRHVFFTAEDSYGDKAVHEVNQLVNTNPVFTSTPVTSINVGQLYTYNITVNDPDVLYGDVLAMFANALPAWATFVDNGNGTASITGTPVLADVGSYAVVLTAEDMHHHYYPSQIPQHSFTITVNPCNLVLSETHVNETCNAANGSIDLTVTGVNNPATYSWTGPNSFSASSEDILGLTAGVYTIDITDAFGCNETMQVTIANDPDLTAPSVYTKDITIHLNVMGYASISAADVNNGSDDNCGIASLSVSPNNFSCNEYGLNSVTLTATDASGNNSTATAVVNVIYPSTQATFNANDYINNGYSSYLGNGEYRLTAATYSQFGSVWYQNQLDLSQDFELEFDVFLGYNNGGADGMAFVLQPLNTGQGSSGGGLGYAGINPSLVVEFDTWQNYSDPSGDHIALTANGNTYHNNSNNLAGPVQVSNLENGQYHSVKITWNSQATNLKVVLDGSQLINYTGNVVSSIFSGNSGVYWGFTGATGGAYNDQRVKIKTVNFVEQLNVSNVSIVPSECADSEDGSIDIAVVPFNPCYTYLWSNGETTEDVSNLNAGTYTVTISHPDGSSITKSYVVPVGDQTPPTIITQNATLQLDANGNTNLSLNNVLLSATDNCEIASTSVSPNTFNCSNVGINTVTITSIDVNGNSSAATALVTIEDNIVPIAIIQNITIQLDASGNANITTGDIDNGSNDACGIDTYSLSQYAFDCSHVGANSVTLTVEDNNGNSSSAVATVNIEDKVAAIALSKDITVQLDGSGNIGIVAADVDNGSHDACGIANLSVFPNQFDCSTVGLNIVTLTVTDVNGNVSNTTAHVTVEDNVAPIALTKNITIQLDANGSASIVAADVNDGSNDACGIASLSVAPNTFVCSNAGNNTVTLTVTDVNGNASSETANVLVEDNISPTLSCVSDQEHCANIPFTNEYIVVGSTFDLTAMWDNCSIVSITNDQNNSTSLAGHMFATGNTVVTWTVEDPSGNSTSCSFTVTVNPLPVASIATTGADEWCNGVTLTASGSTFSSGNSFAWSSSETSESIVLTTTESSAGTYSVFVTDPNGCTSPIPAEYDFAPENLASSYTLIGFKRVKLGENNTVINGSIGATNTGAQAHLGKNDDVTGTGSFIKADSIVVHPTADYNSLIASQATIVLPTMNYYNLSGGTYNAQTVKKNTSKTITGNYVSVKVEEGASAILEGRVFGTIEIGLGASVHFSSSDIDIEKLLISSVPKGKKASVAYAVVSFAGETTVRVKERIDIDGYAYVNNDNYKVIFYIGENTRGKKPELDIKSDDVSFSGSVYVPGGKIQVHGAPKSGVTTYMNGFFIAETIESNGKNVNWDWYNCYQSSNGANPRFIGESTFVELGEMSLKAYPNPFSIIANIEFSVSENGHAIVEIYNMVGQKVETLFDGEVEAGNSYTRVFHSDELAKGIYFVKLNTGNESLVERIILAY